jgi:hypothetical protein
MAIGMLLFFCNFSNSLLDVGLGKFRMLSRKCVNKLFDAILLAVNEIDKLR